MEKTVSTQTELIECLGHFFADCADECEIDMAFLYGSRARGLPRIDSDVDVAVLFGKQDLPDEEAFARIADISLKLDAFVKSLQDALRSWFDILRYLRTGVPRT